MSPAPGSMRGAAGLLEGRVIAAHGRHYEVEITEVETTAAKTSLAAAAASAPSPTIRQCYPRGKKAAAATVGDWVRIRPDGPAGGVIEHVQARRNLLIRADASHHKHLAANLDQLLIVIAPAPPYSEDLLGRALTAAWCAGVQPLVILNKIDLFSEPLARQAHHAIRARLAWLAALDVPVLEVCAHEPGALRTTLAPHLAGRVSLLLGQSGMGKSTLLNALLPTAQAATRAHSTALNSGRHTTTSTRLYHLPAEICPQSSDLIDAPGFQSFGLAHLSSAEVLRGFPEFDAPAQHCRFYNCTHQHEPGCGVLAAVSNGQIPAARHALYLRMVAEQADRQP